MSKSKPASKSSLGNLNKELQKKVEELTYSLELLKTENEELKTKLKVLCKKIVDNTDLSDYSFIDANIEPDHIDINDLLHMIQKLALLASQINTDENIENHVEALELRITELTNENSSFFKNKLKLQERLEFIMQERDVWKRNAETLKKMYAKLVKEREFQPQIKSNPNANKCTIGTYRGNVDSKNPTQRTFSATVPKDYYDNIRNTNITNLQIEKIDQSISNQLSQIVTPRTVENDPNDKTFFINETNFQNFNSIPINDQSANKNQIYYQTNNNTNTVYSEGFITFPTLDSKKVEQYSPLQSEFDNKSDRMSDYYAQSEISAHNHLANNIELIDRPITNTSNNKKIVSFNNDIDVRIFRKNSKNSTKIVDSYMLPLTPSQQQQQLQQQQLQQQQNNQTSEKTNVIEENFNIVNKKTQPIDDSMNNNNLLKNRFTKPSSATDINSLYSMIQKPGSSSMSSINNNNENRYPNRTSVCSTKKLPGETPVKELEPTLKMIIIKELSVDKLDGKDWRMFALRVGISENEIKEWISLKLQYPMARVLSFWSSKPEATIRVLHRHLNAPCFNYMPLAKRIENFYDVL